MYSSSKSLSFIALLFILVAFTNLQAQQDPKTGSGFRLVIMNDKQVSETVLEFDIYLQSTDAKVPFRFAMMQAGILVNPQIVNGGTITASIIPGSSELVEDMQPRSIRFSAGCIKILSSLGKVDERYSKSDERGVIIHAAVPGTRICRVRLTNSVAFGNASANLSFNFAIKPYPTKVAAYVSDYNTMLFCSEKNCLSEAGNKPLNDLHPKK